MTREDAKKYIYECLDYTEATKVIKALEQEPMEKFESVKDHIFKLAGDYKCWDNRLTYDEALELCHILEQEPCEDCVSRQAVLEEIPVLWNGKGDKDYCMETLRDFVAELPPVTPAQKWIPVTEDTPPKGTICLWCNKQGSVFASEITYRSECSSYVGKHGYFSNGLENYGDIVAWMPLPEPYRAEMESEE